MNPAAQQDADAKSHGDREERAWHGLDSGKQETNSLEISYDLCRSGTISNCLGQGLVRGGQAHCLATKPQKLFRKQARLLLDSRVEGSSLQIMEAE